jgi:hypothetical protein
MAGRLSATIAATVRIPKIVLFIAISPLYFVESRITVPMLAHGRYHAMARWARRDGTKVAENIYHLLTELT